MHNDSCSEPFLTSALLALNPAMPLLTIADSFYIGVLDIEYTEKLGLQTVPAKMNDPEGVCRVGLLQKDQTCIAVLEPGGQTD
jgi:hypothetical protein